MKDLVAPVKTAAKRDWSLPRVGEVCRLINGRVYKKNELLQEGRYRVLRVGNFFTNQNWYFSDLELDTDKYCEDGDLLYAWSASFGPRIWRGEKTIYHYHIWKVEPDRRKVIRDFLYYFFEWDKDLIREEQGAGATMIHVSKKSMDARAIPLPPLEEQKRIVAVLDQAFAALERARAHTEANMASANDLFGSILDSTLAIDGKGWKRHPLKSLGAIQTGSTPKTSEAQNYGKHIPFIKPGDFRPDGSLVLDNEGLRV